MTPIELVAQEILEKAKAATPRPWSLDRNTWSIHPPYKDVGEDHCSIVDSDSIDRLPDAKYIVATANHASTLAENVLSLLTEIERMKSGDLFVSQCIQIAEARRERDVLVAEVKRLTDINKAYEKDTVEFGRLSDEIALLITDRDRLTEENAELRTRRHDDIRDAMGDYGEQDANQIKELKALLREASRIVCPQLCDTNDHAPLCKRIDAAVEDGK